MEILQLRNTVTEIKTLADVLNSRLESTEERIIDLEIGQ